MNITPITASAPVCLGVCCPVHGTCARYFAIETAAPEVLRIDYCGPEHSLFQAMPPVAVKADGLTAQADPT